MKSKLIIIIKVDYFENIKNIKKYYDIFA